MRVEQRKAQAIAREFSRRYFGGRVSSYRVQFDLSRDSMGACWRQAETIFVNPRLHRNWRQLQETLVHELAHAVTTGFHGRAWRKEMARLAAAGAPVGCFDGEPPRLRTTPVFLPARGKR